MKTWITADLHLGEDRFELMGRPFKYQDEMVDWLIYQHNNLVKPEDDVIVVGDVCYQKTPEFLEYVKWFNGRKMLVRGNHDRVFTDEQLKRYFEGGIIGDGGGFFQQCGGIPCYITHYPTTGVKNAFNLVGHIHAAWKYQLNMLNVGVDVHHFCPVNIETIPFHLTAITKFYDEDVWVAYDEINSQFRGKRGKPGNYFTPPAKTP